MMLFYVQNAAGALICKCFPLFQTDKVLKDGDGKEDQNHQRPSARGTEHFFLGSIINVLILDTCNNSSELQRNILS